MKPRPLGYQLITGRLYDKLVRVYPDGVRSAMAFIHRETGVIYQAKGWSNPGRIATTRDTGLYRGTFIPLAERVTS